MAGGNRGKESRAVYLSEDEQRRVRPYVQLYVRNKQHKFPDDDKTIGNMQDDFLEIADYIYKRCSDKGYAEKEMIEELHNIALVFRGYCTRDKEEIWKLKWIDYFICFFDHLLRGGLRYDKGVVITLLVESGLPEFLSMCISQVTEYEYDFGLISGYLDDPSVSPVNKHMLCFMISRVCRSVKDNININIEELSEDELITAIRTQYYEGEEKTWVNKRLANLLSRMRGDDSMKERYDQIIRDVINLHIENLLPLTMYSGLVEYHRLYRLLYHSKEIDYSSIELNVFINVKSQRIIDNAIKYGSYVLYERVREEYRRDKRIKFCEAFRQILSIDIYKYIYDTEAEEKRKKLNRRA